MKRNGKGDNSAEDQELRLSDASKRHVRNCDGESNAGFSLEWAPDLQRCPNSQMTEEVRQAISLWSEWEDYKSLPYPGGIADQPNYVYQAIDCARREFSKIQPDIERRANG